MRELVAEGAVEASELEVKAFITGSKPKVRAILIKSARVTTLLSKITTPSDSITTRSFPNGT